MATICAAARLPALTGLRGWVIAAGEPPRRRSPQYRVVPRDGSLRHWVPRRRAFGSPGPCVTGRRPRRSRGGGDISPMEGGRRDATAADRQLVGVDCATVLPLHQPLKPSEPDGSLALGNEGRRVGGSALGGESVVTAFFAPRSADPRRWLIPSGHLRPGIISSGRHRPGQGRRACPGVSASRRHRPDAVDAGTRQAMQGNRQNEDRRELRR